MFQIDWKFVFLCSHWIKPIVTVSELNNVFSVARSYSVIVHDCDVFNQFNQSPLHVTCICSFYRSIDDTLTASHCVEKELSRCEAWIKTVFDKSSSFRSLEKAREMGQWSLCESILDSFTSDSLLADTADHLT